MKKKRERPKITRFSSTILRTQFLERIRRVTGIGENDALSILNPSFGDRLIDCFYIFGNYPWDQADHPTTLFSFPEDQTDSNHYADICFPDGNKFIKKKCHLISSVYDHSQIEEAQFYTLYFPHNSEPAYLYCLRISCNPLTIPSLCHSYSIFQLLEYVNEQAMPFCDICIAVKSRIPNYLLFFDFMKWVLSSEITARLQIVETIDDFQSARLISTTNSWPENHRENFMEKLRPFLNSSLPEKDGELLLIDFPPYPLFESIFSRSQAELEKKCLACFLSKLSIKNFWTIFSWLLAEQSIVIYHPDKDVVCNSVLSLHFLIKPLTWTFCSLSLLSPSFLEILNIPHPVIIGTIKPIQPANQFLLVNLERDEITLNQEIILHPKASQFSKSFQKLFSSLKNRNPNPTLAMEVLDKCREYVKQMLDVFNSSIISDFSNSEHIKSRFFIELYLQHFQAPERDFMQQFCSTQMAMLYIEQLCRKRSDDMKPTSISSFSLDQS